jgi:hypothetical protein
MTLSNEARQNLERYLDEMRASMAGSASDVAEIEQDIRDHIEAELGERAAPISAGDLDAVLTRLGNPGQRMGASAAVPIPHEMTREDWLAYGSTPLLLLGLLAPLLIPASWLVARWSLARMEQRGEQRTTRRWLVYPPLAFVSIAILLLALFWPAGAFAEVGMIIAQRLGAVGSDRFPPAVAFAVAIACLGGYWIILGALSALGERAMRFLFHPFADGFRRRHAWWFSGAGALLALCAAVVFFWLR